MKGHRGSVVEMVKRCTAQLGAAGTCPEIVQIAFDGELMWGQQLGGLLDGLVRVARTELATAI
jgi:hypothetical protein